MKLEEWGTHDLPVTSAEAEGHPEALHVAEASISGHLDQCQSGER